MTQQITLTRDLTKEINMLLHEQFVSLVKPFQKIEGAHQKRFDADKDNWISKELQLYGFPTFAMYYHIHFILQKEYVIEMNHLRSEFKKKKTVFDRKIMKLEKLEIALGIDFYTNEERKRKDKLVANRKKNGMIPGKHYTKNEILTIRRQKVGLKKRRQSQLAII